MSEAMAISPSLTVPRRGRGEGTPAPGVLVKHTDFDDGVEIQKFGQKGEWGVSICRWGFACLSVMSFVLVPGCPEVIPPQGGANTIDDAAIKRTVLKWNQIAVDASGLDHAPANVGAPHEFGHQLGPTRSSRAMAIVHVAVGDVVAATSGDFESYTGLNVDSTEISEEAAIAQAAHDTLVALFPSQSASFDNALTDELAAIADGAAKNAGIDLGQQAAAAILALREGDGSELTVPYEFSDAPGAWRTDPINPDQQPLGEEWYRVTPFVLNGAAQFRCPPPPAMNSAEYTAAFNEVKELGGDGIATPTTRTDEQTQIGLYWAYDGTPSLCAPPRLYNQLARQIADDQELGGVETARLLALMNVALADAGIAVWESKYHYNFWRPVTGVREADEGTGPTGLGDGNPDTLGDPTYVPLCAPASNLAGPNFTPPFPAYPSGHAGFGGALFQTLRSFLGTDDVTFTFVSDELNGVTVDNEGNVRPLVPRTFTSLSQAEEENGQSRIYLGIHWSFDKTAGIAQGQQVADYVFANAFRPTE